MVAKAAGRNCAKKSPIKKAAFQGRKAAPLVNFDSAGLGHKAQIGP